MGLPEICTLKELPADQRVAAAQRAIQINPANAHIPNALQKMAPREVIAPDRLALLTSKYWGREGVRLTVGFLDGGPADLRARILAHMNAWGAFANVRFSETAGSAQVRIARTAGGGYWSYLGTDVLHLGEREPTMNLDSFTMSTPDSEFFRVIRHETGHTLGFPHEHMRSEIIDRIDREKAITYFMSTQGWSRDEVIAQVLTPLDASALLATAHADPSSIMCYWLPGSIMRDGAAVPGGTDIDPQDAAFARSVYPSWPDWRPLDDNAASAQIVADGANLYQLHRSGAIWKFIGPPGAPFAGKWQQLDGNPNSVKIAASGGALYQLHRDGKIWKFTGPAGGAPSFSGWVQLDENPATKDIIADGPNLYQLHSTGAVWKFTGPPGAPFAGKWQQLDGNPHTKKLAASGDVLYQLHDTGAIWKFDGPASGAPSFSGWVQLDGNAACKDIVADGPNLYQLHSTGAVWKFIGPPGAPFAGKWQQLDGNPSTVSIAAAGGALFQLHSTGAIWKFIPGAPSAGKWQQLDGNADSAALAVAPGHLYQIHHSGSIWEFTG